MKKGKRFLSLALSLCAISLTACSSEYTYPDNNWIEGQIAVIGGKAYQYKEIYDYFNNTKASAQAYFTVAKNVIAQYVTPINDAMRNSVDTKINNLHDTWKSNANSNNTSYKEEQEKTFDSENVENEDELRAKYLAEAQVDQNSTDYTLNQTDATTKESYYISQAATEKYVEDKAPYHVSHILVKVDASSSGDGYYAGQISSDDAKQLGNVTRMLSSGQSFGSVAQSSSDDTGSAAQYGECYTKDQMAGMDLSTSYINEFKLGLYAYDAFLNPNTTGTTAGDNAANDLVRATLRVPGKEITSGDKTYDNKTDVSESVKDTLIGQAKAFGIPVSVAFTLQYLSEETTNPEDGSTVQYASANQYPRNILFNNYFNYRGVNFLYDDSDDYDTTFWNEYGTLINAKSLALGGDKIINSMSDFQSKAGKSSDAYIKEKHDEYVYVSDLLTHMDKDVFQEVGKIGDKLVGYNQTALTDRSSDAESYISLRKGRKILCDTSNHPIIVVRGGSGSGDSGYQGIHFIIVNNDPFTKDANGAYTNKYKYYRVNLPTTSEAGADSTDYETNPSYINFVKADVKTPTTYNERRSTVTNVIKNSDSNSDISLYQSNLVAFQKKYGKSFDEAVLGDKADIINKYISLTLASTKDTSKDSLDSSWETYINELNMQQNLASSRMIPTVCVSAFESGSYDSKMEEICHVEKK